MYHYTLITAHIILIPWHDPWCRWRYNAWVTDCWFEYTVYHTNISQHIALQHNTSQLLTIHQSKTSHNTILSYHITIYYTNSSYHYTTLHSKHLKLQCIAMKDDGKSTDEIMRALNITKGHVEKWYSPKVTHSVTLTLTCLLTHLYTTHSLTNLLFE